MNSQNFVIVGASSGIGQALAQTLTNAGHQVFGYSRQKPSNDRVNFTTWDAISNEPFEVANLPETIHGIVYCPGSINLKPFNRLTTKDFQQDFQLNVLGAITAIQAVLPKLKLANGASVVLFSTVAVQTGMGFHASVAASKGAIEGLTRSLASELAPSKIRVNAIAPSLTDTPLAKGLLNSPEKIETNNKRHPIGRIGTDVEVAKMAQFLLEESGSWITGQVIGMNGGMGNLK